MKSSLFVYGTLRHDQPEHARYCRGVTGWRPARVRGRLCRLAEGYLLLVVPREDILLPASTDAAADEHRRAALSAGWALHPAPSSNSPEADWIDGELLEFADATIAWPPLDKWEGFVPGRPGAYQRCVVPVAVGATDEGPAAIVAAWCYVAVEPPAGAVPALA